jgi:hypothetical protein
MHGLPLAQCTDIPILPPIGICVPPRLYWSVKLMLCE